MLRTIARNIAASWIGFAVHVAVTFFLTPFVVRTLGDARYGAWSVIMGLTGYYGLLDFGFRAGLTQYLARYLATKDYERLNRTASTGFTALSGISVVLLAVTAVASLGAPYLFDLPTDVVGEVRWSIVIVGIGIAIQFPFFCYSAALTAAQRYDISNAIGIVTRLLSAALMVAVLRSGLGLIGIAAVTLAANVTDYALRAFATNWAIPQLRVRPGECDRSTFRDFFSFGMWNTAISASRRILSYGSTLIIAVFLPVAAVTPFALANSVTDYVDKLLTPAGRVFFPAATELDATNQKERLQLLYLNGTRFVFAMAVACGLVGGLWSGDFFRTWIGADSVNGFGSAASLTPWLLTATVLTAGQRVGYQILLGMRQVRMLAILFVVEATVTLMLTLVLIGPLSLTGVVLATVISASVVQFGVHPIVVCKHLNLSLRTFAARVLLPTTLFTMIGGGTLYALRSTLLPATAGWGNLSIHGVAAMALLVSCAFVICLDADERRSVISVVSSRSNGRTPSVVAKPIEVAD